MKINEFQVLCSSGLNLREYMTSLVMRLYPNPYTMQYPLVGIYAGSSSSTFVSTPFVPKLAIIVGDGPPVFCVGNNLSLGSGLLDDSILISGSITYLGNSLLFIGSSGFTNSILSFVQSGFIVRNILNINGANYFYCCF
ncbi:MAG: hypothetical protein QXP66_00825 [Candidatus Aenigmatarchaeota archaeon]